jgi:protein-tyrosine phosphatase
MMLTKLEPYEFWLGSVVDARDVRAILDRGITAVVDLAINEPPIAYPRDIVNCRIPLLDGQGNSLASLRLAIGTVTTLLAAKVPMLLFCSMGMSRSPVIAAAAISLHEGIPLEQSLPRVVRDRPVDVSPTLLSEVAQCLD